MPSTAVGSVLAGVAVLAGVGVGSILGVRFFFKALKEIEVNGNGAVIPIEMSPRYKERDQVKPGLTGLAQIYATRDLLRQQKFRYDLVYIRNQRLWLDLKLIALSFWITFSGKWEYRGRKF